MSNISEKDNTTANQYYNDLGDGVKVVGVDWDNTIVVDEWPWCGPEIKGAKEVLRGIVAAGHRLILFTQRDYEYPENCEELTEFGKDKGYTAEGNLDLLSEPVAWFRKNHIPLFGINENGLWEAYTEDRGRKIYMDFLIDDHNVGMQYNIVTNRFGKDCKTIDWKFVDNWLVENGIYGQHVL